MAAFGGRKSRCFQEFVFPSFEEVWAKSSVGVAQTVFLLNIVFVPLPKWGSFDENGWVSPRQSHGLEKAGLILP